MGEPYTKQLSGKLRELRFHLDGRAWRISYWIASGRRIIRLTVFPKARQRETAQVARYEAGGTVPTIALLERLAFALDAELTVSVNPRTAA